MRKNRKASLDTRTGSPPAAPPTCRCRNTSRAASCAACVQVPAYAYLGTRSAQVRPSSGPTVCHALVQQGPQHYSQDGSRHRASSGHRSLLLSCCHPRPGAALSPHEKRAPRTEHVLTECNASPRQLGSMQAHLQLLGQLEHLAEHCDARVAQAAPARHLHHQARARVLSQVVAVNGQRRQAKDGVARAIGCKVDVHAEGVAGAAVVHGAHVGAEVRVLRPFHLQQQRRPLLFVRSEPACMICTLMPDTGAVNCVDCTAARTCAGSPASN